MPAVPGEDEGQGRAFRRLSEAQLLGAVRCNCRQAGIAPDADAANAAVAIWLREVANARVHATTGEVPAERLVIERPVLQPLPWPYRGRPIRASHRTPGPSRGYQHPLSVYDDLLVPRQPAPATVEVSPGVPA